MNNRKNGLLVLGVIGLLIGIWMSFAGFAQTTSDQYQVEAAFNGAYGSETIDEANMMIGVGLVILIVSLIMIVNGKKKAAVSKENYEIKNSSEQFMNTDYNPNSLAHKQESNANEKEAPSIAPLLRRAEIFLEDGDFNLAHEYYNRVLDIEPECSKAYMGLVLVEQKLKDINELACSGLDITESGNYKKALRFADNAYKKILEDLDPLTFERKENDRKESIYIKAVRWTKLATSSKDYMKAYELFESISGYKDSNQCLLKCNELIKELEKVEEDERIKAKREEEERLEQDRIIEIRYKKRKKVFGVSFFSLLAVSTVIILVINSVIPWCNYSSANKLLKNKQYFEAAIAFSDLGDFRGSTEKSHSLIQNLSSLISTTKSNTVGLKKNGTVVATGYNEDGQYDDISSWEDIVTISTGYNHTIGLKKDGTVVAAGYNEDGQCDVSLWKDIVAISAGGSHTVGLRKDGTVVATGDNWKGRCDVSLWKDIVAISAGGSHTVGLRKDGTVVATGYNEDGQCDVSLWKDIVTISTTGYQTVGLKKDGTVVAAGYNEDGQCDVSLWKDIVAISADRFHTVGLRKDGTVVAVGDNKWGACDVSSWKDIVAISANYHITVGLKKDGTVVAAGETEVCDVFDDWKDIVAINAGDTQTIGLKKDGTVVAVGYNLEGECDVSDWSDITLSEDMYNFGK